MEVANESAMASSIIFWTKSSLGAVVQPLNAAAMKKAKENTRTAVPHASRWPSL